MTYTSYSSLYKALNTISTLKKCIKSDENGFVVSSNNCKFVNIDQGYTGSIDVGKFLVDLSNDSIFVTSSKEFLKPVLANLNEDFSDQSSIALYNNRNAKGDSYGSLKLIDFAKALVQAKFTTSGYTSSAANLEIFLENYNIATNTTTFSNCINAKKLKTTGKCFTLAQDQNNKIFYIDAGTLATTLMNFLRSTDKIVISDTSSIASTIDGKDSISIAINNGISAEISSVSSNSVQAAFDDRYYIKTKIASLAHGVSFNGLTEAFSAAIKINDNQANSKMDCSSSFANVVTPGGNTSANIAAAMNSCNFSLNNTIIQNYLSKFLHTDSGEDITLTEVLSALGDAVQINYFQTVKSIDCSPQIAAIALAGGNTAANISLMMTKCNFSPAFIESSIVENYIKKILNTPAINAGENVNIKDVANAINTAITSNSLQQDRTTDCSSDFTSVSSVNNNTHANISALLATCPILAQLNKSITQGYLESFLEANSGKNVTVEEVMSAFAGAALLNNYQSNRDVSCINLLESIIGPFNNTSSNIEAAVSGCNFQSSISSGPLSHYIAILLEAVA